MKTTSAWLVRLTVTALHLGHAPSHAAVPQLLSYQGRLVDLGPPLPSYWATFWIYDAPTNGLLLWGPETYDLGLPTNRLFTVLLGTTNPIPASVFSGTNAYLEIAVQGTVLRPRTRLVTTPYAFRAESASTADLALQVRANSISAVHLQAGAVTEEKIGVSEVTTAKLRDRCVTTDKLDNWAVPSVKLAPDTTVDMVDSLHADPKPSGGMLLALDNAGYFPNVVLHTGHGEELNADMVDGKHATDFLSSTPPITLVGTHEAPAWVVKAVHLTNGFGLIGQSEVGLGVLGESVLGGPGVRGVAMDGRDGFFFGVEGLGRGGGRGFSENGVGVLAESISGKALVVNGTAEFNGDIFFNGNVAGEIDGELIRHQTIRGTKLFPGGMMDQVGPLGGAFLWKFRASQPGIAALQTETSATGTNGVALHSKAGSSGIDRPGQAVGHLAETQDGFGMVAQADRGIALQGASTSGKAIVAHALSTNAWALEALGRSSFKGDLQGALSHFLNGHGPGDARLHALIGEVTAKPAAGHGDHGPQRGQPQRCGDPCQGRPLRAWPSESGRGHWGDKFRDGRDRA
jgi:hypothetical protein